MAEPIGWMEKYALAADREGILDQLIPGSDDFYFYHCLHNQTTGQLAQSESFLQDWLTMHKGRETAAITSMIDRQRLLTYEDSPQRTIDHLVRRLGIRLHHSPPATKNERRFPSQLDEKLLGAEVLVKDAIRRNDALKPLGIQFLAKRFRNGKTAGISINLSQFLARITGAYVDGLDELVIQELQGRRANQKRFGDLAAHKFLTLKELQNVARRVPEVTDDNSFVAAILERLRPGADSDPSQQSQVRIDYLTRVESYLRTLPPSYNSMKASATYRRLEANVSAGVFDEELFLRYLQLPRVSPIVHQDWARRDGHRANLNQDFMELALLPPIGDEQPLVRAHLEHFLRNAANTDQFSQFLQPAYLRQVFAETKLIFGVGDPEQWYKMLSASQRQQIRDAVELRLTPENPKYFSVDQPTRLHLDVKNMQELIVRIYEINTQSYYRTHDKRIDTDIDLDGLVATHEKKLIFNQPAIARHSESIELEEITGRGVWIVDMVGQGVRARAMVRRGSIDHIETTSANGMVFTIIDENRQPIPAATMWVGSREFIASDEGVILLPPVADQVSRTTVIGDGSLATRVTFSHLREQYHLTAGMHVDRTQLQSGGEVELLIRPRLSMAGAIIDPKTLTNVSVRVEAKDLDGLSITHEVIDLELDQNGELVVPIRVPARLARLSTTLTGKITGISDGKQQTLQVSRSWDIGGIRRTHFTHDSFLTRDGEEFVIEVRGRNGEIISNAAVNLSLTSQLRASPIELVLQSNEQGQVRLGELVGIEQIRYSVPAGIPHERDLGSDGALWANEIHTAAGSTVLLPLPENFQDIQTRFRLLQIRGQSYRSDVSDLLSTDQGLLKIDGLDPGDYELIDRVSARSTRIAVVDGPVLGSVAVGRTRLREISPAMPLGIASIQLAEDGWKVQLSGKTDAARVHVYASRYLDQTTPLGQLDLGSPGLQGRSVSRPPSGYVSDLRLGDEYQYVLRRRYAKKYPGVMLPQPSILLNPWETEETTNSSQDARAGEAPSASAPRPAVMQSESMQRKAETQSQATSSDFDFLADAGVVIANLRPDKDNVVTIPFDIVEGLPVMQIVVCDPATMLQRTVATKLEEAETNDLRLAKALGSARPLTFRRGITVASPDNPLDLKSLGSAQVQVYASVGDLFKLYKTLVNDPRLSEFDQLGAWHELDRQDKMAAYARLASHELHLFLWFHDKSFFADVIQPYLVNKKEKQFIDHWLLGDDLNQYSRLWRYNQLCAAERALLAMRMPEVRESVQRELREVVAQQDRNHAAVRVRLESALNQRHLGRIGELDDSVALLGMAIGGSDADGDFAFRSDLSMERGAGSKRSARKNKSRLAEKKSDVMFGEADVSGKAMFGGRIMLGGAVPSLAFYRDLDSTKQWAESHWDRVRTVGGPSPASLIRTNSFWADLSKRNADAIGVSSNLLDPVESRHAALVALALSGLPLTSGEVGLPTNPDEPYRPAHAVAVVTKQLKVLKRSDEESSILIGQRFSALDSSGNPVVNDHDSQLPAEPTEFLTGEAYQGQIVISNPTAASRTVDVFWQLPQGSLPLSSSQTTDSKTLTLDPYAVQAITYNFYFPSDGKFAHYPATVAAKNELLGQAAEKSFTVVAQVSDDDSITWPKIARSGSAEQIKAFLAGTNLRKIDWMLVAHRMRDQEVYQVIVQTLEDANMPIRELWAYGFAHRDEKAMQSFLSLQADFVNRVGPSLESTLLAFEPVSRRTQELLEYAPLVRARIHRLGHENEILNPTFLDQYRGFVRTLGYSSEPDSEQKLVLTYYLLIQNRITEAIETFGTIDRGAVATMLQYDYLDAYLAMHQEQFDKAEKAARAHADHPVPRWKHRFDELLSQLKQRRELNQVEKLVSVDSADSDHSVPEGSGDLSVMDRERRQSDAADQQPEVIVRVDGQSLRLDHRHTKHAVLNFYGVDLELLFSQAPFVREDLQRMAMVRPMKTEAIKFDASMGVGRYDLSENLRRQTLLVELVSGASRSTALSYGGDITTYVSESFGQLQTTDATTHRPISTAYVKVYAKYADGSVRFYKDGYTDSRGRFDYTSVSAGDAKGAARYAILVINEEKGATLHDVAAPSQ